MKEIKVYTQARAGLCGSYSLLNALQFSGVNITEQEVLSWGPIFGFPAMEKLLLKNKKAKGIEFVNSINLVESFLSGGTPLMALLYRNNFESVRKAPFCNDLNGKMNHFICLIEDCGDKFKYRDQQGENFGDHGNGYILKSDFNKIKVARIIF